MKQKDAILTILKEHKKTQVWLAEALGYSNPTGVSQMLRRGNITVDTLARICDLFDYEITIQPKRTKGKPPQGQLLIEGSGKKK